MLRFEGMTQSGRHVKSANSINAVRVALASAVVGVLTAAVLVLASAAPTVVLAAAPATPVAAVAPVAPGVLVPAAPVTAAPTTSATAAPASARSRASQESERPRATATRSRTSGEGCGRRAVTAGVFNPSCSEYQGYLDPGRAGGRAPSSGDIQSEWGCEQGYIPADECD